MKSYFLGCSGGGRQALKEVQMYPEDFDGVLAGQFIRFNAFPWLTARRLSWMVVGKFHCSGWPANCFKSSRV